MAAILTSRRMLNARDDRYSLRPAGPYVGAHSAYEVKMVDFLIGHYTYRMFSPAIDIIPTLQL